MNIFSCGIAACLLVLLMQGCSADSVEVALAPGKDAKTGEAAKSDSDEQQEDEGEEEEEEEEEEGEPDFARLTAAQAKEAGIVVAEASTGVVDAGVRLTGILVIDPKRVTRVRARFQGLVKTMRKEVGDPVVRGEALATIESNESLTIYTVTAPASGVVLDRHVNLGEMSGDGPLYTLGDIGALQAELKVFPSSRAKVRPGAVASVIIGADEVPGTVTSILPELDVRTQARRARVTFTGALPADLVAGQFVAARIASATAANSVVVPASAVRQLEGRNVVFVPDESDGKPGFRAVPVELGEQGKERVAIRSGLDPGDRFVTEGAFLLKAEIGKRLAADED